MTKKLSAKKQREVNKSAEQQETPVPAEAPAEEPAPVAVETPAPVEAAKKETPGKQEKNSPAERRYGIRLIEEVAEKFEQEAVHNCVPVSNYLSMILTRYMDNKKTM